MKIGSFAFPFMCTPLAPAADCCSPRLSRTEGHSPLYKHSKKNNNNKKTAERLFFLVSQFIKLIKHLDHDPAETENVPFIKLFGPDYPLLCKLLAPRTGEAVGRLELIAFNSHFTPAQGTSSKNQNPTDALVMPSLPQMGIGARAAAAAAVSRAGPRSLRWAPRARGNVKTPQRREEKNSPLSTFLPFFFYEQN